MERRMFGQGQGGFMGSTPPTQTKVPGSLMMTKDEDEDQHQDQMWYNH